LGTTLLAAPVGALPPQASAIDQRDRTEALLRYRDGQQRMAAEDYPGAETAFRDAVRLDRQLAAAHYGLGQVLMATRRYAEAVRAYTACREAFREFDTFRMSDQAAAEQRLDEEIRSLQDTIRSLQTGRTTSPVLGQTIGKYEDQMRELQRRRGRLGDGRPQPTPPGVSLALGSAYFRTGDLAAAEREYRAALEVDPGVGEAWNNLAVVCLLGGRAGEAADAVKRAEKTGFKVPEALKRDIEARRKAKP
jgi:tetratricopeptide (TPR) repeat protein